MKNRFQQFFVFIGRFTLFSVCFSIVLVVALKWIPVAWTPLMFFREMGDKIPEKTPIRHEWVSADEIAISLPLAVVCTEDQRFLTHHGFDWESIQKAWEKSESGKHSGGASSISQQTAKNVFCWPTSSFIRKIPETWFTVLIEGIWGKDRILEVYLNSVEFGPGIYGAEAASLYFFDKHAVKLSNDQCARLAAVLPNPLEYKANATKGYVITNKNRALGQMKNYGFDIELTRVNGPKDEEDDNSTSSGTR
jgi:monofunctional biosynthetic peptidoglycan transglycosylase